MKGNFDKIATEIESCEDRADAQVNNLIESLMKRTESNVLLCAILI